MGITQSILTSWRDLEVLKENLDVQTNHHWIFRGQRNSCWNLKSSLERIVCDRFKKSLEELPVWERWLVTEFRRHAHRYIAENINPSDTMRWLTLMQHHGAPTRLLDFTYSFYIALYFAIEDAEPGSHCTLWAVDANQCWNKAKKTLPEHIAESIKQDPCSGKTPSIQAEILSLAQCGVVPDNSFTLDERLAVQQGVFLVPLDLTESFMKNLNFDSQDNQEYFKRYEICCSIEFLKEAFTNLHRMNINRGSLFPGLDGFAKGLNTRISFSDPS
jgi:hypothetical protein